MLRYLIKTPYQKSYVTWKLPVVNFRLTSITAPSQQSSGQIRPRRKPNILSLNEIMQPLSLRRFCDTCPVSFKSQRKDKAMVNSRGEQRIFRSPTDNRCEQVPAGPFDVPCWRSGIRPGFLKRQLLWRVIFMKVFRSILATQRITTRVKGKIHNWGMILLK